MLGSAPTSADVRAAPLNASAFCSDVRVRTCLTHSYRRHLAGVQVKDLKSENGLLHNGTPVNLAVLEDGDLIIFGAAESIYQYRFSSNVSLPTQSQSLPSSLDQSESQSQSLPSLDPSESA